MTLISINGNLFDPQSPVTNIQPFEIGLDDASNSDYILIQMSDPTPEQKHELAKLGAILHECVSDETYLYGFKKTDLAPIRNLSFVNSVSIYRPDLKIPASLKPEAAPTVLGAVSAPPPSVSRTVHTVDVVFHEDVDASSDDVKSAVASNARVDATSLNISRNRVRLHVEERYLNDVAGVDQVREIQEVHPVKLLNNVARTIMKADVVVNGTGYSGKGQVVAVADTGFDKGSTTDCLPAFAGRVANLYGLGRPNKFDDPKGHGTHVCGSVLGDGSSTSMGVKIQGTAPSASLVVQSLLDGYGGLGGIPIDLANLFTPPYQNDQARVHTNSWGSDPTSGQLAYSLRSRDIDDFVWSHPDMVICFAAGNSGTDDNKDGVVDPAQIGAEAAAKNCITVGACESKRLEIAATYGTFWPRKFSAAPIRNDPMVNSPNGMAAFSSRGPTVERRFKPDLVAPGTSILSAHSRNAPLETTFGQSSDALWMYDSGTSMSTPLVAGCAAVLRETLVSNGIAKPSAARIKAMLINGADELSGQYIPSEAGPSPNNNSGFGRVNLANSVIILGQTPNAGCGEGGPLAQGKEDTITIHIPPTTGTATTGATLKITLVWTDPAGPVLQNDLDLIVKASDGTERHGNVGLSTDFDRLNNVEQVVWANMPPGVAKVTIRAFKITRFAQPYAYAWRIS
jgi:serine protease AprX